MKKASEHAGARSLAFEIGDFAAGFSLLKCGGLPRWAWAGKTSLSKRAPEFTSRVRPHAVQNDFILRFVHESGAPPRTRTRTTTMRNTIIALALAAAALTAGTSASQAGYGHSYGYDNYSYGYQQTYYQPTYYCHTVTFQVYDEYSCQYVYRTKQVCN